MALPDKNGGITVKAVNDRLTKQEVKLILTLVDTAGKTTLTEKITKQIPADKAIDIATLKKGKLPAGHILILDYESADGSKGRAHFANEPYKALSFSDPHITHTATIKNNALHITLSAKNLSLFTSAETGVDGSYSENVLDLLPNEKAEIIFTPTNARDLEAAHKNLCIRNLYSSSH